MPSQPQRGQGQWALGHHEPLNPAERFKKDDNGLHVRDRILNRYAHLGFDSIDPTDLRGRFRWWGLYTQRKPGISGGKTGALEDAEIEDPYFMMRVRIPGGQLTANQLRAVAGVAKEYGRDLADVTDRQNIQFHWLRIEDIPAVWARLEEVGLSSQEACGDVPRNILGCPVAGLDASEILDASAALRATNAIATSREDLANLPRKYKTSISGCTLQCTSHEINDISFVGVLGPGGQPGFDLWVGGGLSTNPMLAQRLGAFVPPERVPEVWSAVTSLFRDYGYRRLRSRARLKFLVADWGAERFREVLEREYLEGNRLADGPAPPFPAPGSRDHLGVHRQQDGRYYVGVAPHTGRTSGTQLWQVADLAESYGSGQVRTTVEQKLIITDVPEQRVAELVAELAAIDLQATPNVFRRGTMACTGIEFCKLAIVETKGRARDLYTELARRLPDFDTPITINVNGCPNSCARFQLADIGLKGSIVDGAEGFQVHLGGSLGAEAGFGRKFRGLKVSADGLTDYVEQLLRNYQADRAEGEQFATWVRRADPELLTLTEAAPAIGARR
ncbi:MAG: nitrite/sulfite reductase [Actinobacteria bacterium]|nr:nitrite/sulfite reductase [Actinomycetota bacterium]MBO0835461.1 nitrite/sulfite reductase [Actinomycetota bacterium]